MQMEVVFYGGEGAFFHWVICRKFGVGEGGWWTCVTDGPFIVKGKKQRAFEDKEYSVHKVKSSFLCSPWPWSSLVHMKWIGSMLMYFGLVSGLCSFLAFVFVFGLFYVAVYVQALLFL